MLVTACDHCGATIAPTENAYRVHDPRGFGTDYQLCSTDCLTATAGRVASLAPVDAKAWT